MPRVAFSPLIASIHLAKTTFHLPRGHSHRRLVSRLGSAERAFANDFLTRESSSSSSSSSSVVPNSRPKRTVSPRVRGTRGGTISPRGNGHLWYLKFGTFVHAREVARPLEPRMGAIDQRRHAHTDSRPLVSTVCFAVPQSRRKSSKSSKKQCPRRYPVGNFIFDSTKKNNFPTGHLWEACKKCYFATFVRLGQGGHVLAPLAFRDSILKKS